VLRRCPEKQHRPRDPAEFEAWRITGFHATWRPRLHPRWKDAARPVLDLAACRAVHDPSAASWTEVAALLGAMEVGARAAAKAQETDDGG